METNKEGAADPVESKIEKSGELQPNVEDNIIPEGVLDALPAEERGRVAAIIKQTMISGMMTRSNPISDKITSEHITDLISKSDEQDKRDRKERKEEKLYNLVLIILGLLFIGFLVVYLTDNQDLLIKVIIALISFVGGFGIGKSRGAKQD